jgi:hypothetical protein
MEDIISELRNGWWTTLTPPNIPPQISSLSKRSITMTINKMDVFGSLVITPFPIIKATNLSTIPLTTSFPTRVVHIL